MKSNVSFSRYLDFCASVKLIDFKICDVIIGIASWWNLHMLISFRFLSTIKMKFGEILVSCMRSISEMFLGQCWRLETSSRSFYDFIKMKIQQDLAIFNVWHLSSLIVSYSPFQKIETLKSWHYLLLSNWRRLLNWKGPRT